MLISSKAIQLKPVSNSSWPFLQRLRSEPANNRFLDRKPFSTEMEAIQFTQNLVDGMNSGKHFFWIIEDKVNDKPMGSLCVWNISPDRTSAEIGYELLPEFRGKGIMTRSLDALVNYVKGYLPIKLLKAYTHQHNTASLNVLERLGFEFQGVASPDEPDFVYYQLSL